MSELLDLDTVDQRQLHRYFGVTFNNQMWDELDRQALSPESDPETREQALYRAFASAYHWRQAGDPMHWGRAEHLISRTALAIGEYQLGLRHAQRYLDLIEAHPDQAEDWDHAFAYEALARALAANGRPEKGPEALAEAISRTEALAEDEDRQILQGELGREPWFGLKG